jgi:hypothetical protein
VTWWGYFFCRGYGYGVVIPGGYLPIAISTGGAPDTVRWHTGQSGAPDQGSLRLSLALIVEPFSLSFYWLVVNLWHLYNL